MHPDHVDDMNVNGFFDDLTVFNDAGPDLKNILIKSYDFDIPPECIADEIPDMLNYLQDGVLDEDFELYEEHASLLDIYVRASNVEFYQHDADFFRTLFKETKLRHSLAMSHLGYLKNVKGAIKDYYYKKLYIEIKNISVLMGLLNREFNKFDGYIGLPPGGLSC
tara:strand:+ start:1531 stop:2025 length:495 start_codon:yes stop_codon:yes gene_type:complete